jgi:hypothetical protein
VVLTHGYWQRRFGGRPVVGESMRVDGEVREIVGVLPASFRFLQAEPSLVMPLQFNRAEVPVGNFSYQGIARLKPGVTIEQAQADLSTVASQLAKEYPRTNEKTGARVLPLRDHLVGNVQLAVRLLAGAVCLVLLIPV